MGQHMCSTHLRAGLYWQNIPTANCWDLAQTGLINEKKYVSILENKDGQVVLEWTPSLENPENCIVLRIISALLSSYST